MNWVPRRSRRRSLSPLLLAAALLATGSASGAPVQLSGEAAPSGQPEVHLDRLEFPRDLQNHETFKKHLAQTLRREVRRADWGAGAGNRIEYRFSVTELSFSLSDGVLGVRCSAVGRLPGGQTAKSDITFGGAPGERTRLVKKVLEIVARGVVTRLSELERRRRGLD